MVFFLFGQFYTLSKITFLKKFRFLIRIKIKPIPFSKVSTVSEFVKNISIAMFFSRSLSPTNQIYLSTQTFPSKVHFVEANAPRKLWALRASFTWQHFCSFFPVFVHIDNSCNFVQFHSECCGQFCTNLFKLFARLDRNFQSC